MPSENYRVYDKDHNVVSVYSPRNRATCFDYVRNLGTRSLLAIRDATKCLPKSPGVCNLRV